MAHLIGTHFGTYQVARDTAGRPTLTDFELDPAPSPIGPGLIELADHPARIAQPMVRKGWLTSPGRAPAPGRGKEPFVPMSWDKALDLVASEIDRVRNQHGNRTIYAGSYGWASAGRFHHAQSQLKRLLNLLGGFVNSVNTYSYGCATVLLSHVLGPIHAGAGAVAPRWDEIAAETDLMLAFGGMRPSNAQVESGGCGRHMVMEWLTRATARGMRLVVFSPSRRDLSPAITGEHHFIRPNTDAAVLLAMAHVLLKERLHDAAFVERYTSGFETVERYLLGQDDGRAKTPQWAAEISGLDAALISDMARRLAAQRSVVNLSWSLQRARFGEQPYWAGVTLAALAGHIGRPGGGFACGLGSVNSTGQPRRLLCGPAVPQGTNPVSDFIPVARIADMLLKPGEPFAYDGQTLNYPRIRLLYWAGGNPFHHHQDLNRLAAAFAQPETIVVHEAFWTASARRADIVLPVRLPTERDDIVVSSRDNWIVANRRCMEPVAQARTDHEVCAGIAERFALRAAFTENRDEQQWLQHLYDGYRARYQMMPSFEAFWDRGFFELDERDDPDSPHTALMRFVEDPDASPLQTPSGRIELYSPRIAAFGYADCPGHAAWLAPEEWLGAPAAARHPIHLMSPQPEAKLHSQLDAATASRSRKKGGRETVLINSGDAAKRGIAAGDLVRLYNDRGACLAAAVPSEDVMSGVAVLPTGAWFDPASDGRLDKHGNPNVLTADIGTSSLAQGCAANSCLVEIERYSGSAPEVTAYDPPATETSAL